jgi:hypothetical protein
MDSDSENSLIQAEGLMDVNTNPLYVPHYNLPAHQAEAHSFLDLEKYLNHSSSSASYTITSCTSIKHTHTWRISNFSLLPFNKSQPIESLAFTVGPAEFIMRCFPYGRLHEASDRCSVFIQLIGLNNSSSSAPNSRQSTPNKYNNNNNNNLGRLAKQRRARHSNELAEPSPVSVPNTLPLANLEEFPAIPVSETSSLGPSVTVHYRLRFVFPSGERNNDEVIPHHSKAPYCYDFGVGDEHDGSYITKSAIEQRGFLSQGNDTLNLQAEIELLVKPATQVSFSDKLLAHKNTDSGNSGQSAATTVMGKQFYELWEKREFCDVKFKINEASSSIQRPRDPPSNSNSGSNNNSHNNNSCSMKKDLSGSAASSSITALDCSSEEKMISAHKFVLSARSSVFSAMFSHEMQESRDSVIELYDISRDTLLRFLFHMYTGQLPTLSNMNHSDDNNNSNNNTVSNSIKAVSSLNLRNIPPLSSWSDCIQLYQAAVKYAVDYLCELVAWEIAESITVDNVLLTLQFAEYNKTNAGAYTIRSAAKNFLLRRLDEVIASSTAVEKANSVHGYDDISALLGFTKVSHADRSTPNINSIQRAVQSLDETEQEIPELATVKIRLNSPPYNSPIAQGMLLKWRGEFSSKRLPERHAAVLIQQILQADRCRDFMAELEFPPINCSEILALSPGNIYFIPHLNIISERLNAIEGRSREASGQRALDNSTSGSSLSRQNQGNSTSNTSNTNNTTNISNNNNNHSNLKRSHSLENLNESYEPDANTSSSNSNLAESSADSKKRRRN